MLEVGDVLAITDYFVITERGQHTRGATIAEEVEARVAEAGEMPARPPSRASTTCRWVLIDYSGLRGPRLPRRDAPVLRPRAAVGRRPRLDWADQAARAGLSAKERGRLPRGSRRLPVRQLAMSSEPRCRRTGMTSRSPTRSRTPGCPRGRCARRRARQQHPMSRLPARRSARSPGWPRDGVHRGRDQDLR